MNEVETLYTNILESGDRTRAMQRLRVPPLEEKQPQIVTFRLGMFIGMICTFKSNLFIRIIKNSSHLFTHRVEFVGFKNYPESLNHQMDAKIPDLSLISTLKKLRISFNTFENVWIDPMI
jgi:hypothetical protein